MKRYLRQSSGGVRQLMADQSVDAACMRVPHPLRKAEEYNGFKYEHGVRIAVASQVLLQAGVLLLFLLNLILAERVSLGRRPGPRAWSTPACASAAG